MSGVLAIFTRERRFLDGYEKNVLVSFSYKKHTVQLNKRTNGRASGAIKQYLVGTPVVVKVSEFYSTTILISKSSNIKRT